jgi:hypothetical protein
MRAPGTGAFYGGVLVVAVGMTAFFAMPVWAADGEGGADVYWVVAATGVAVYCGRQLTRPAPALFRRVDRRPPGRDIS